MRGWVRSEAPITPAAIASQSSSLRLSSSGPRQACSAAVAVPYWSSASISQAARSGAIPPSCSGVSTASVRFRKFLPKGRAATAERARPGCSNSSSVYDMRIRTSRSRQSPSAVAGLRSTPASSSSRTAACSSAVLRTYT